MGRFGGHQRSGAGVSRGLARACATDRHMAIPSMQGTRRAAVRALQAIGNAAARRLRPAKTAKLFFDAALVEDDAPPGFQAAFFIGKQA